MVFNGDKIKLASIESGLKDNASCIGLYYFKYRSSPLLQHIVPVLKFDNSYHLYSNDSLNHVYIEMFKKENSNRFDTIALKEIQRIYLNGIVIEATIPSY